MQGNRTNDEIEKLCLKQAKENWFKVGNIISKVESKNLQEPLLIEGYQKLKQNQVNSGEDYNHYMDVYLNLVHVDFKTEEELWEHLTQLYPAIISKSYWCITLFSRILGTTEERAVAYYNNNI